jgi:Arc/MetJ-type ribon-helix-helix transcriptional regulator
MLDSRASPSDSGVMRVDLDRDVEDFLQEQVRNGVCRKPGDLVNDLLRSVREQQQRPFEITPELEAWLLDSADIPVTPLKSEDFEGIRQRVRARME